MAIFTHVTVGTNNLAKAREFYDAVLAPLARSTDVIVLPEMFTTGFSMDVEKFAEDVGGPTSQWLQQKARDLGAAITGSVMTAATQANAPSTRPGYVGLRPWNSREAFQTMPQVRKPTALSASANISPNRAAPNVHIATEAAPTR